MDSEGGKECTMTYMYNVYKYMYTNMYIHTCSIHVLMRDENMYMYMCMCENMYMYIRLLAVPVYMYIHETQYEYNYARVC